jgi:hypothetical protein
MVEREIIEIRDLSSHDADSRNRRWITAADAAVIVATLIAGAGLLLAVLWLVDQTLRT